MAISTVGTVVGVVFSILSFLVSPSLPVFAPLITVALLGLFFTTSPLCAHRLPCMCTNCTCTDQSTL